MLRKTGEDWNLCVYETYLDDSGTSSQSEIAIAACYVSSESGWRRFVKEWDSARIDEGFDYFHMAEFVAPREQGHRPWCDWDNEKKDRVFNRLATIVNDNKRIGIGCAVPKAIYDAVPEKIRRHYGNEHYTFAVRTCLIEIWRWRERSSISHPIQYIFDYEKPGTPKHTEISGLMGNMHPSWQAIFGLDTGGYSFQSKKLFKPLQAADILAWQIHNYIPEIYPHNETQQDVKEKLHPGFAKLRVGQEMSLVFFDRPNCDAWVKRLTDFEAQHGIIP
jgi:hypothetical protein